MSLSLEELETVAHIWSIIWCAFRPNNLHKASFACDIANFLHNNHSTNTRSQEFSLDLTLDEINKIFLFPKQRDFFSKSAFVGRVNFVRASDGSGGKKWKLDLSILRTLLLSRQIWGH